ncbi:unnamed protein product [Ilex paraguariensis]|uniref:Uncharacterized protein n=1 Tax=Ilex paraguariensis TaxID=185542 RepID=A0ABC8TN38_9AQUA
MGTTKKEWKQKTSLGKGKGMVIEPGNMKIQASPILKASINIETCNKFASLVVDLSGIQENVMEKSASPMKSLLSSKVKNIDGIPIGTTRMKKQKQKSPNQGKVGVSEAQGDKEIKDEAVDYFQNLMGRRSSQDSYRTIAIRNILQSTITREQSQIISNEVTGAEIKEV